MSVRLVGGIGQLCVSMPVLPAVGGFFGLGIAALKGLIYLLWVHLVRCCWLLFGRYWLLRAIYWEAPRTG